MRLKEVMEVRPGRKMAESVFIEQLCMCADVISCWHMQSSNITKWSKKDHKKAKLVRETQLPSQTDNNVTKGRFNDLSSS